MNIFIIDTNIIFSSILNSESEIGRFIISSSRNEVKLYAPEFLQVEIERYIPKLIKLSSTDEKIIRRIITLVYSQITFISRSEEHTSELQSRENLVCR